jgi:putative transposase
LGKRSDRPASYLSRSLGQSKVSFSQRARTAEAVFLYIAEQEIHHRRMTFQDEFRALLNKHGIRFDERYVWD